METRTTTFCHHSLTMLNRSSLRQFRQPRISSNSSHQPDRTKLLRFESLEARRLLAITVDTLDDVVDGADGMTSLREAISEANQIVGTDEIDIVVAGTISLDPVLGEISINSSLTIRGPGHELLTIDGSDSSRIFSVNDGTSQLLDVTIDQLTLDNGRSTAHGGAIFNNENLTINASEVTNSTSMWAGGGIDNLGTLTINDSTLSGNNSFDADDGGSGGAIRNRGTLTINDSTLSNNSSNGSGGAIRNEANRTLTLNNTTLSGNRADRGGGLANYGTTYLNNSSLDNNTSSSYQGGGAYNADFGTLSIFESSITGNDSARGGGGIFSSGTLDISRSEISGNTAEYYDGGGIHNDVGTATISNSTLSGNTAERGNGGGVSGLGYKTRLSGSTISGNTASYFGGGVFSLEEFESSISGSTITGNTGGGFYVQSNFTLTSTILANNTSGPDFSNYGSFYPTSSKNLVADGSYSGFPDTITGDPMLGPLADNGGPTLTHALLPGSPAIDAGASSAAFDQRGMPFVRSFDDPDTLGDGPDIGAYERQTFPNTAPIITSSNTASIEENSQAVLQLTATDEDVPAQIVSFRLTGSGADNALFELTAQNELRFIVAPDFENATDANGDSTYEVSLIADDGNGGLTPQTVTVTIDPVNDNAPILSTIGDQAVDEGVELAFTATATDADLPEDTLMFSLDVGAPEGASIDANTGEFTWTPMEAKGPGSFDVTVRVSDGEAGLDDFEIFTITVAELNTAPIITSPNNASTEENSQAVLDLTATDDDLPVQPISFSLSGSGADNALFEIGPSNQLRFIEIPPLLPFTVPDFEDPLDANGDNVYEVSVIADDGSGGVTPQTITVTILPVSDLSPVLGQIGDQAIDEGSELVFTATASDADLPGDSLTFSLDPGAPSGATIDPDSGEFRWVPSESDGPGNFDVTIRVTDDGEFLLDDFETFTVTVNEINSAPTLVVPPTVLVEENTQFVTGGLIEDEDSSPQSIALSIAGSGADNELFALFYAAPLFALEFATAPDFESPADSDGDNIYEVTLEADDSNGGITSETILVTVEDVFDSGQTFVVDNTIDESDGDFSEGDLSLREAIELANSEPDGNTILFDPSLAGGTILLSQGQFSITAPVTIAGPGADQLTIDADDSSRHFFIRDSNTEKFPVTLSGLTLTGGQAVDGGSIENREDLTILDSVIRGNSASRDGGGIINRGAALTVERTAINDNTANNVGGGILNTAGSEGGVEVLNVLQSTISDNRADRGSGIFNNRTLNIVNSTVSGNTGRTGVGVTNYGHATISNSTITQNAASSSFATGGINSTGSNSLSASLRISGSLIADNRGFDVNVRGDESVSSFQSLGHNLIGSVTGTQINFSPLRGDQVGITDPMIGPLANNGGPTLTHALLPGSPAIDAGNPSFDPNAFDPPLNNDQRGAPYLRSFGSAIDVGSVEFQAARVVDVIVGGDWDAGFVDAIDGGGVDEGNGLGLSLVGTHQLDTLPWLNVNAVYLVFSKDVSASVADGDIQISGTNAGAYSLGQLEYGVEGANVLTIPFSGGIALDSVVLSILSGDIADEAGIALDGEWISGQSAPSGNGTAGGQFDFFFNVLPGDENGSGQVNAFDALSIFASSSTATTETLARRDTDGSGQITTTDALAANANDTLGLPTAPTPPTEVSALSVRLPAAEPQRLDLTAVTAYQSMLHGEQEELASTEPIQRETFETPSVDSRRAFRAVANLPRRTDYVTLDSSRDSDYAKEVDAVMSVIGERDHGLLQRDAFATQIRARPERRAGWR